jgi:hypothetical protein
MYLDALGNRVSWACISKVTKVQVTIARCTPTTFSSCCAAINRTATPGTTGQVRIEHHKKRRLHRPASSTTTPSIGNVISRHHFGGAAQEELRLLNLDLKGPQFQGPMKGMYVIQVRDTTERQWLQSEQAGVRDGLSLV